MFNTSGGELNQSIKHESHSHNILQGFTKLLLLHVWKLSQSKNFQHAQKLKQIIHIRLNLCPFTPKR